MSNGKSADQQIDVPRTPTESMLVARLQALFFKTRHLFFPPIRHPHMQRSPTLNLGMGGMGRWPPHDDRHLFIPHRYLWRACFGCVKRVCVALTPCVVCSVVAASAGETTAWPVRITMGGAEPLGPTLKLGMNPGHVCVVHVVFVRDHARD